MLNEKVRAEEILDGVKFNKEYFTTAYIILIRYFLWQGYSPLEVRERILEWEKKYDKHRTFDLNKLIISTEENTMPFRDTCNINITKNDINTILNRFDCTEVRRVALAFLCYAKAINEVEFSVSYPSLSQFAKVNYTTLQKAYLPELFKFKYIEKIEVKNKEWGWEKRSKMNKYSMKQVVFRILVPIDDIDEESKYILKDNNFVEFCDKCFSNS